VPKDRNSYSSPGKQQIVMKHATTTTKTTFAADSILWTASISSMEEVFDSFALLGYM